MAVDGLQLQSGARLLHMPRYGVVRTWAVRRCTSWSHRATRQDLAVGNGSSTSKTAARCGTQSGLLPVCVACCPVSFPKRHGSPRPRSQP